MHRPSRAVAGLLLVLLAGACRSPGSQSPAPDLNAEADAAARRALASEQSLDPATLASASVGIAPLAVRTSDTLAAPLGYGLADLLITDLSRSAALQVVDRVRVDALLREMRLTTSGAVDASQAPRVGKLLGARRLIVGALSSAPDGQLRIDARVADVQSGIVQSGVDASAPLDRILDAEKALAFHLFDRLGVTLTPAERAAVEQRPTASIAALLAYSRGVRADALGQYDVAGAEYAEAARLDPGFQMAVSRARTARGGRPSGARLARGGGRHERVQRAAELAAGELNRSLAQRLGGRGANVNRAVDAAFTNAQVATLILIIRVVP